MFVFTVDESEFCTSADPGFDPEPQEKHNELPFAIAPTAQGSSQSFLELLHAPVSPATSTKLQISCNLAKLQISCNLAKLHEICNCMKFARNLQFS